MGKKFPMIGDLRMSATRRNGVSSPFMLAACTFPASRISIQGVLPGMARPRRKAEVLISPLCLTSDFDDAAVNSAMILEPRCPSLSVATSVRLPGSLQQARQRFGLGRRSHESPKIRRSFSEPGLATDPEPIRQTCESSDARYPSFLLVLLGDTQSEYSTDILFKSRQDL